eukprot:symbB.v1.2.013385.t1/scaffold948.1/size149721/1
MMCAPRIFSRFQFAPAKNHPRFPRRFFNARSPPAGRSKICGRRLAAEKTAAPTAAEQVQLAGCKDLCEGQKADLDLPLEVADVVQPPSSSRPWWCHKSLDVDSESDTEDLLLCDDEEEPSTGYPTSDFCKEVPPVPVLDATPKLHGAKDLEANAAMKHAILVDEMMGHGSSIAEYRSYFRARVYNIYVQKDPEKVSGVDMMLSTFKVILHRSVDRLLLLALS